MLKLVDIWLVIYAVASFVHKIIMGMWYSYNWDPSLIIKAVTLTVYGTQVRDYWIIVYVVKDWKYIKWLDSSCLTEKHIMLL